MENGEDPAEESKKEENKVTKPEPASEKIGLRPANRENIDETFKVVLMENWTKLCLNYKQSMKKVFS